MTRTIKIIPSWRDVGRKMYRTSQGLRGLYTLLDTYPNMISYLSDGLDSTYQEASWPSSTERTVDVLYINKIDFANQVLSVLPNSATNISIDFVARGKATGAGKGYITLTFTETIDASATDINYYRGNGIGIPYVDTIGNTQVSLASNEQSKSSVFTRINSLSGDDIVFEIRATAYGEVATVCDVWVTLTYDTTYPTAKVKVNGSWEESKPYVKVNGSWEEATNAFVKVIGSWEEVT